MGQPTPPFNKKNGCWITQGLMIQNDGLQASNLIYLQVRSPVKSLLTCKHGAGKTSEEIKAHMWVNYNISLV